MLDCWSVNSLPSSSSPGFWSMFIVSGFNSCVSKRWTFVSKMKWPTNKKCAQVFKNSQRKQCSFHLVAELEGDSPPPSRLLSKESIVVGMLGNYDDAGILLCGGLFVWSCRLCFSPTPFILINRKPFLSKWIDLFEVHRAQLILHPPMWTVSDGNSCSEIGARFHLVYMCRTFKFQVTVVIIS